MLNFLTFCTLWASLTILRCKLIAAAATAALVVACACTQCLKQTNTFTFYVQCSCGRSNICRRTRFAREKNGIRLRVINDQTNNTFNDMAQERWSLTEGNHRQHWYFSFVCLKSTTCSTFAYLFYFIYFLSARRRVSQMEKYDNNNANGKEKWKEKDNWKWIFNAPL